MSGRPGGASDSATTARRALDLIIAVVGLTVLAIPAMLVAVVIRLDSPGPALFSQLRLGRDGRQFRMYKFRKFARSSSNAGRSVTVRGDPRMTRVGRLLERTKVDELPQLWNLLRGDFADCFVGPTRNLLLYKPGMLGPSQVLFRNEGAMYPPGCDPETFYRDRLFPVKARIDLSYFPHRTFSSDIAWLSRGILALFGSSVFRIRAEPAGMQIEKRVGRSWQSCPLSALAPLTHEISGLAENGGQGGASPAGILGTSPILQPRRPTPSHRWNS
jgi:lipopolysaccharide/colanic/teichoic acid biosynthesis glycosyltransferase